MDKTEMKSATKEMKIQSFLNKLKKKEFEVLGVKIISDNMIEGVVSDSYIYDVSDTSNIEFTSVLKVHASDVDRLKDFMYIAEQTGFADINMSELYGQLNVGQGFLTAQILKDMKTSENFRVSMRHRFVNPTVEYQDFKIGKDNKYRLYRIYEKGIVTDFNDEDVEYTHGVEILTTVPEYDGETLLGKLALEESLTPASAKNLLMLISGNTILNKEIGGAYYSGEELRVNLFNINYKGMRIIVNQEDQRVSVLSSNSFINSDLSKLKSAEVISKADNTRFELNFNFGKEKELTIYI